MAMRSEMTLKVAGTSIHFNSNVKQYARLLRATKKQVRDRFAAAMSVWATWVKTLAIAYAPRYSSDGNPNRLDRSIDMVETYGIGGAGPRGQMRVQVGVRDDWQSEYDLRRPPWGSSSYQVAIALHESWNTLAKKKAKQRAAKKWDKIKDSLPDWATGVHGGVGESYLTRAAEAATEYYGKYIKYFRIMRPKTLSSAPGSVDEVIQNTLAWDGEMRKIAQDQRTADAALSDINRALDFLSLMEGPEVVIGYDERGPIYAHNEGD